MKQLIIASHNPGKIAEIRHALASHALELLSLSDFPGLPDIDESGQTFAENAAIKAETICRITGMPVLADDSGLEVDALDQRPGVFSARYGTPELDDKGRYEYLLDEMRDVPTAQRGARFRCAMALARPGEKTIFFEGAVAGAITTAPAGDGGFGYDPIFVPTRFSRTMAELSTDEKERISHRGAAIKALAYWLALERDDTRWDLRAIFASDHLFARALQEARDQIAAYDSYRDRLGEHIDILRDCLQHHTDLSRALERLGSYAFLRASEDLNDSQGQSLLAHYRNVATRAGEAASFLSPQLLAIAPERIDAWRQDPKLAPWSIMLERWLRFRPHTLRPEEERILAMQGEIRGAPGQIFRQLNDADFRFGSVRDAQGDHVELTHGSWGSLQESPDREVRKQSFQKMYAVYEAHANTLAATLHASVQEDVFAARVRHFASAREAALFDDNVSTAVYDNLIQTVRDHMDVHHRYLALQQRKLGVSALRVYDTYVPLAAAPRTETTWDDAVQQIADALAPLGPEYVQTLQAGLTTQRWSDRFERSGKRSGAFSAGGYDTPPYILMNYRADSLRSVYTLAHEAGHSMHTWYSAQSQPYPHWEYSIFVAEVASTFNEQLLTRHLLRRASDDATRAYIIDQEIAQIRMTLVRQTMFAEFEKRIHEIVENESPLTLEVFRSEYSALLDVYFGPLLARDDAHTMEWGRIPHFYNAFYVYKYATGIAAAIALADAVCGDDSAAQGRYLNFLRSGGAAFPLDQLRDAGVDLNSPAPIAKAMARYAALVDELETLLP